ncbi:hypothetical protein PR048_011830 [Dryococelus australis]|uniref:Uncharacterized protein n=1 Tax=Dryococelus australis TaxID=614101 RepID=A0ABQ9HMS9_9NEOP|nr:hypothetical protein PR048_011830 [Dryococelus australis]
MTCVALRNFLRRRKRTQYPPGSTMYRTNLEEAYVEEGDWRQAQPSRCFGCVRNVRQGNPTTEEASVNLDNYVQYFNGPGKVPFQDRVVSNRV